MYIRNFPQHSLANNWNKHVSNQYMWMRVILWRLIRVGLNIYIFNFFFYREFQYIVLSTSTDNSLSNLISLRISGLDDLASVELPTVVEGPQRTKCCQRGDRRWPAKPPPMTKLSSLVIVWSALLFLATKVKM